MPPYHQPLLSLCRLDTARQPPAGQVPVMTGGGCAARVSKHLPKPQAVAFCYLFQRPHLGKGLRGGLECVWDFLSM